MSISVYAYTFTHYRCWACTHAYTFFSLSMKIYMYRYVMYVTLISMVLYAYSYAKNAFIQLLCEGKTLWTAHLNCM